VLTKKQIVEKAVASDSYFGFDKEVFVTYLTFNQAKPLLKPEVTSEKWGKVRSLSRVEEDMKSYMIFAISKAADHRGISAHRSIEKMQAYTAILEVDDQIDWERYRNYGAPILRQICDAMGWQELYTTEIEDWDRKPFDRMSQSKKCRDSCNEGCG